MQSDQCMSFYLSNGLVKGHFCRLSTSITNALENHNYSNKIKSLLAEMAAISQCFTMDIKTDSQTTMQITGTSPVKLALVNSLNCESFRCCATINQQASKNIDQLSLPQVFGQDGKLIFTIDFANQYYQTIVELNASSLQECFQHYFIQSQQIPTIVMVCSTVEDKKIESAALILQKMPSISKTHIEEENQTWHEAACFASTIKPQELIDTKSSLKNFISLVFNDLNPVVSRETSLSFCCTCNNKKIVDILKNFGDQDLNEEKIFEVVCEYCNKKYTIDKTEIDS